MIARPTWERPLRRRLHRKRERRALLPGWIKDQAGIMVIALVLFAVLAVDGEKLLGAGGGGTGIGVGAGLAGAFIGLCLRARWLDHGWLTEWTPASRLVARRIQTREIIPLVIPVVLAVMIFAAVAACFGSTTGIGEALAAAAVTMGSGFLLAGGRISMRILIASIIWTIGYCILSPWFLDDTARLTTRIVKGAVLGWLPVMPWSMPVHGAPAGALQWLVLGGALAISLREWWKSWHDGIAPPAGLALAAPAGGPETGEVAPGEEAEERPAPDEEQRKSIRQQVAFAWFGLAGYLPDSPMPWFDRLIWRWLAPRQRLISTLGSHDAFEWFAQTRWTVLSLALMAALGWLPQSARHRPEFGAWFDSHAFWFLVLFVALSAVAILSGWPSRRSRFQPWLEQMEAQGIGLFPAFALLPICPGEWLRAAAKEWTLRAAWVSLLWSLATATWVPASSFSGSAVPTLAALVLPWLLHAALFPLSAMNRLVNAVSGPAFRGHGFTRTVPSILAGILCLITTPSAVLALGTGYYGVALLLGALAAASGALSLWLTLRRCTGMRLDLKSKRVG